MDSQGTPWYCEFGSSKIARIDPPPGVESNGLWFLNPDGVPIEIKAAPKTSPDEKSAFSQPSVGPGIRSQDPQIEAVLQIDAVGGAEPVEQPAVGGEGAQHHVLAVVHGQVGAAVGARALEGMRGAAQARARLVQLHVDPGLLERDRRRDPGQAAADHGHAHGLTPASARAATTAFSQAGSDIRAFRALIGCSAMRRSSRR